MASIDSSGRALLGELSPIATITDFMTSIGYRFISGLRDCEQDAGLEHLGMRVYETVNGQISAQGQIFYLFSASPPLGETEVTEAKRQNIELYKVEKL
ncbi:TPA: hypothetical protein HA238_01735 [Candidatus Micrarchaeota archaeon]|nr:hypothetical protein [Candidatus Micrarchaeota archaeon]